jgi:hypothetical protein
MGAAFTQPWMQRKNPETRWFNSEGFYSAHPNRLEAALDHGARGTEIVAGPVEVDQVGCVRPVE